MTLVVVVGRSVANMVCCQCTIKREQKKAAKFLQWTENCSVVLDGV